MIIKIIELHILMNETIFKKSSKKLGNLRWNAEYDRRISTYKTSLKEMENKEVPYMSLKINGIWNQSTPYLRTKQLN